MPRIHWDFETPVLLFFQLLVGFLSRLARLCLPAVSLLGILLVAGCISSITPLSVEKLQFVHPSEPIVPSNKSTKVLLVEREDGGLIVAGDKQIAFYDRDFNLERKVNSAHKYYEFGLVQGPDGAPWFAGYEWWSWLFRLANMNVQVHAMPLGDSVPTFAWSCKNCSDVLVQRFDEPLHEYLYAASFHHLPTWVAFDLSTGTRFGSSTYEELVDVLTENLLEVERTNQNSANKQVGIRYASQEWWRHAYATCASGSRALMGMRRGDAPNCVWHPVQANNDAEFIVRLDDWHRRIVVSDDTTGREIDSWDLSDLVDAFGFAELVGWFRFLDSDCVDTDDFSAKEVCSRTIAVVSGTWTRGFDESRNADEITRVFELEDGGHARLLKLIPAPSRAAVRLVDGRIVVAAGHNLVFLDPPTVTVEGS